MFNPMNTICRVPELVSSGVAAVVDPVPPRLDLDDRVNVVKRPAHPRIAGADASTPRALPVQLRIRRPFGVAIRRGKLEGCAPVREG